MRHKLENFFASVLLISIVWSQDSDITPPSDTISPDVIGSASAEATENGPGKVTFILGLDWTQLWKRDATYEEVPETERAEWIEDTVLAAMKIMKRKFHRPEVLEHSILKFEDNNVLVEFPDLTGKSKEELELITADFIQTISVRTVGAAYRDQEKIDLFGRDASKEARSRAR